MQTILGSNGIISTEIAKELHENYTRNIRLAYGKNNKDKF